jgi:pSer/pThr/pTyr-binding forkhead associated (FHA) protein
MSNRNKKSDISITFMSGPWDGKIMTFEQPNIGKQKVIGIGRREGCDIHLPFDNQVSRLHAKLTCSARPVTATDSTTQPQILMFWLEDGGSRNGTFVEKDQDPLRERISLRPGTLFKIGRTWLRLDVPLSF